MRKATKIKGTVCPKCGASDNIAGTDSTVQVHKDADAIIVEKAIRKTLRHMS